MLLGSTGSCESTGSLGEALGALGEHWELRGEGTGSWGSTGSLGGALGAAMVTGALGGALGAAGRALGDGYWEALGSVVPLVIVGGVVRGPSAYWEV